MLLALLEAAVGLDGCWLSNQQGWQRSPPRTKMFLFLLMPQLNCQCKCSWLLWAVSTLARKHSEMFYQTKRQRAMSLSLLSEQCGLLTVFNPNTFLEWQILEGRVGQARGRFWAPTPSSAQLPSLGGEGSLWVNQFAFQWEDTLPEINSTFLIINLPDFLPK